MKAYPGFESLRHRHPASRYALRRIGSAANAKQDALRSFSEGGRHLHYVYLLESIDYAGERYVGVTNDLRQRLREHNAGKSKHTSKFAPWRIATYVAFSDRPKAEAFERYLKSGSGHAFARKRLW
ncbi:GIY-YIG nuclease family protein [Phenylobacterium sp.]|uniref:GIY-YIG nuclease family protein n=1 Tax=Phenylobacterium sp. TaxID=1871053 RepID=UPI002FC616D4